jgi:glycosyltransferase involved in cell wall biosynthesis
MICVVIPTLNCIGQISTLLPKLKVFNRIVVADGGSTDGTMQYAAKNSIVALGANGRGSQLALGAKYNCGAQWYFFIHADNELPADINNIVTEQIAKYPTSAGYLKFKAKSNSFPARILNTLVTIRCFLFGLPYGDQGLLISKNMYDDCGGYPPQILFEDVALIEEIKKRYGRRALRPMRGYMLIDITKHERDGIFRRGFKNLALLLAYKRGVSVKKLAETYLNHK